MANYARVHVSVVESANDVRVDVSPWNVTIGPNQDGIEWICNDADFEIEFKHDCHRHFAMQSGNRLKGKKRKLLHKDMAAALKKNDAVNRMIGGSYDVRVTLSDGRVMVVDPDYTRPPRGRP